MELWKQCREIQEDLIRMRRDLHKIPELGASLPKTKRYIMDKLEEFKIPFTENKGDDGLVALIKGAFEGDVIALRSDMDALSIFEENDVDYRSKHGGCMHACGHDAHMSMLLGAAKILSLHKDKIRGSVKLFFQTDEEGAKGAKRMVEEGCMEGVSAVFGTHIGNIISKDIPSGSIICSPGTCMASFDKFIIRIKGKGCHASTPEKGIDPINIAAHIIINLQEILAREIPATKSAVLTIGHMEAGKAYNIIPEEALIEGTIRALEEEVRQKLAKRIEETANYTAKAFRGEAKVEMIWGAPPVKNDPKMAKLVVKCAKEIVGEEMVRECIDAPTMVGEDFSYYANIAPGAFIFLSSSDYEKKTDIPHHNAKFQVDEDVLWIGSGLFVNIIEKLLIQ